jgi:hypothetical protein
MVQLLAKGDTASLAKIVFEHNRRIREYYWEELADLSGGKPMEKKNIL